MKLRAAIFFFPKNDLKNSQVSAPGFSKEKSNSKDYRTMYQHH